ncbi:hypothetical protein DM48_357 [Burkholderia gladioli]|uniref:Variable large protein n=1 Tax=Burkholderia gladioli TaxID=28095 RepID=A0AAW3F3W6_BURGA|nr:hypothetical protein [Burkholderia gladioli]KGC14495.1 hypothetical protein DM48_357 [Burkholderia gladioli]
MHLTSDDKSNVIGLAAAAAAEWAKENVKRGSIVDGPSDKSIGEKIGEIVANAALSAAELLK